MSGLPQYRPWDYPPGYVLRSVRDMRKINMGKLRFLTTMDGSTWINRSDLLTLMDELYGPGFNEALRTEIAGCRYRNPVRPVAEKVSNVEEETKDAPEPTI